MTADPIFIVQALAILVLPVAIWRFLYLRGAVPLVVVQILVGIALGPTLFGRLAPETYQLFFNPATLTPLWGVASIAVLLFGFVTGLHLDSADFLDYLYAFRSPHYDENVRIFKGEVPVPTSDAILEKKQWERAKRLPKAAAV